MSLLTICQNAARRLNIPVPTVVVTSLTDTDLQLFALANEEGKELSRRASWQQLTKEQTFTSVAQETQTGAIPSDFDRILPDTFYNRTRKRQVIGPLNAQDWQAQKALTATVIYDSFRIRGNDILMIPSPQLGDAYAYEYLSKYWVDTDADDAADADAFSADTNSSILDEELITLGVEWRFLKAKGLDYQAHYTAYEMRVMQAISRDGGRTNINMASGSIYNAPRYPGIPEGSWSL